MNIQVKDSQGEGGRTITVAYDFGNEVGDLVKRFGAQAVFAAAVEAFTRDLRAVIKNRLQAGETEEQIQRAVDSWRPLAKAQNEKVSKLGKLLARCTEDDMAEIRKLLAAQEQATN